MDCVLNPRLAASPHPLDFTPAPTVPKDHDSVYRTAPTASMVTWTLLFGCIRDAFVMQRASFFVKKMLAIALARLTPKQNRCYDPYLIVDSEPY
jgi:hypothetical protein